MRLRIVAVLGVICACRTQPAPHATPPPPAIVKPAPPVASTAPSPVPLLTLETPLSPPTIAGTGLRFVARRGDTTLRHGGLWSIAVSRDGMFVATADLNGTIAVWDLRAGTVPTTIHWRLSDGARVATVTLPSPIEAPWAMTFSPDATRLYVGTTLGNVLVFDVVP